MKLLLTADTVGGVWTYALELAKALRPSQTEILLATMGRPLSQEQHRQVTSLHHVSVAESGFKLEWMHDPWDDVQRSGHWLLELEQRFQPDLVHLNTYAHASIPFAAPKLVVAHSCVLSWWRAVKNEDAPQEWNRYREEITAGLRAADMIVAPSNAMLRCLQQYYGPLTRTRVIHNGRDASLFTPGAKEDVILSAGRLWDGAKNLSTLDAIAGQLPWPVLVAGSDTSPDGHVVNATSVKFLGYLEHEQMAARLSTAAIYATPARYEPFGLSILEAGLSGCALVLGDIPSLREIWADAAIYVSPDDSAALRDALLSLIDNPRRRADLAAAALHRASRYTPQLMAGGYHMLYRELVTRATTGSGTLPAAAHP
jgi:glycogen synthase